MRSENVLKEVRWRASTREVTREEASAVLLRGSGFVLRYGLAILILWFGVFKFTPTEAQSIQPLVAHSPLLSWLYVVTDVPGASRLIGAAEIIIALLVAARPLSWRAAAAGSIGATLMFVITLSFLVTTPGSWAVVDGLLVPAGAGGFVIKDLLLLGAALWSTGDALSVPRPTR